MEGLLFLVVALLVLGVVVVGVCAAHVAEGVAHLYLPSSFAPLAFLQLPSHDVAPVEHERKIEGEGYREVREVPVEPPGFEPGVWVVGPSEKPHSRVTVTSPRTAIITVLASGGPPPFRGFTRAIATVRVRCVDTKQGRELEAHALPTCFGVPLSFPLYHGVSALIGAALSPAEMFPSIVTGAIALVVFSPSYWVISRAEIAERTENALEMLEAQLRRPPR